MVEVGGNRDLRFDVYIQLWILYRVVNTQTHILAGRKDLHFFSLSFSDHFTPYVLTVAK